VLLRSHLRSLSPLPKDELLALGFAVSELGALTRELHRIAHVLSQEGRAAAPEQPDLRAVARLCQVLRSDTKALIRANVNSWEIGRPSERVSLSSLPGASELTSSRPVGKWVSTARVAAANPAEIARETALERQLDVTYRYHSATDSGRHSG
jgi:hypothetical protein